eukprot:90056_1
MQLLNSKFAKFALVVALVASVYALEDTASKEKHHHRNHHHRRPHRHHHNQEEVEKPTFKESVNGDMHSAEDNEYLDDYYSYDSDTDDEVETAGIAPHKVVLI